MYTGSIKEQHACRYEGGHAGRLRRRIALKLQHRGALRTLCTKGVAADDCENAADGRLCFCNKFVDHRFWLTL